MREFVTVCQERNDVGIRGIFRALGTLFFKKCPHPQLFFLYFSIISELSYFFACHKYQRL